MMRWWIWLACFVPGLAQAHGGVNRTVAVVDSAEITVRAPTEAVLGALGVPRADAVRHEVALVDWMMEGLSAHTPSGPCAISSSRLAVADAVAVRSELSCGAGEITLRDATLPDAPLGEQTMLVTGVGEHASVLVLDATRPQAVVGERRTAMQVVAAFLWQGGVHLITGYDHVLFLLCLLFVAGPTARRLGRPHALRQLGLIVTAFTVGHSITLVAAASQWVTVAGAWVEVAIAASIGVAAALNIAQPDGNAGHRPLLALGFGLVHGFGFSSVLAELGLPTTQRVLALLSFNVGIELAQLAVVALTILPLAWLARRAALYRMVVMQGGSLAIAALSVLWVTQRLAGGGA
ncbi:MAG: HupE/UreJ family protein [Myxococcales bacterium]|nr:HupE/UreJ family protein [Myxococcales bacterium]